MKHIIREVAPDCADLSYYFDNDGLTEKGGDYCYNLFIISNDGFNRFHGFNIDEYKRVMERAEGVLNGFDDVEHPNGCFNWNVYTSYKSVMLDYSIDYTPRRCHQLKEWAKTADCDKPESIAAFLTITTGKRWDVQGVHGYCQGDYVQIVYCTEHYDDVRPYGEVWLGCAKEFYIIDVDENGEEGDSVGGYIVADCEARDDEDYKRIICGWEGLEPEETRLEMIDGQQTYTKYSYRAC